MISLFEIGITCAKGNYSTTILGEGGADKLSGNGEMYFKSPKHAGLQYIKGAYITPGEIEKVCGYIRTRYDELKWDDSNKFTIDLETLRQAAAVTNAPLVANTATTPDIDDETLGKIIMWALGRETISGNAIDLAFKNIGARKAGRILDRLHTLGIAGDPNVKLGRKVLPVCIEDLPEDVIRFLTGQSYSSEKIKDAFGVKQQLIDMAKKNCAMDEDSIGANSAFISTFSKSPPEKRS